MRHRELFQQYAARVINGERLGHAEATEILSTPVEYVMHLLAHANDVRRCFKGDRIDLCTIINVKSGSCTEDCTFCAQSAHHDTGVSVYPLMPAEEIEKNVRAAEVMQASKVSFVTSGNSLDSAEELEAICRALKAVASGTSLESCASLGALDANALARLKEAGLQGVHHNIETAESFFDEICSTHTYAERVETIKLARAMGFRVCSGGILGMGESSEQRIEMALALRELDVDSVPLNFLNPIPGTPLEDADPIPPLDVLKIIAMFRFLLPDKDIRICGGREINLRALQPLMYIAGISGTMIGNYLTTKGRDYKEDLEMIADLGLHAQLVAGTHGHAPDFNQP